MSESLTDIQVGHRLKELTSQEVGAVVRFYEENKEALSTWSHEIRTAIVALADKSSVATFPDEMAAEILSARADLVDADVLPHLTDEALWRAINKGPPASAARVIMDEMLQREMGVLADAILLSFPELLFDTAVKAYCQRRLHQSWFNKISRRSGTLQAQHWLPAIDSTRELAAALSMLRHPRNLSVGSREFAKTMAEVVDDVMGEERTTMQAALLRTAIDERSPQSWDLLSIILPELRRVVLDAGLSPAAESMLVNDLPRFSSAAYWDLNKRILLSLSDLHSTVPNEGALQRLALSHTDLEIVRQGEEQTTKRQFIYFWPWRW